VVNRLAEAGRALVS